MTRQVMAVVIKNFTKQNKQKCNPELLCYVIQSI